jgi:hypothetical protein
MVDAKLKVLAHSVTAMGDICPMCLSEGHDSDLLFFCRGVEEPTQK